MKHDLYYGDAAMAFFVAMHEEENQERQPWNRLSLDGQLRAVWGMDRRNPGQTFGFMILPSDYLDCRMLACGGAYPEEHPWKPYPMYPNIERRYKARLVFQAIAQAS